MLLDCVEHLEALELLVLHADMSSGSSLGLTTAFSSSGPGFEIRQRRVSFKL